MWKIAAAWVVLACGACGGSSPKTTGSSGPDLFVEGTRLKARWTQAPGAPRHLVGWYDTALQMNCSFGSAYYMKAQQREGGGDLFCLPMTTSATGDLFADAACTQLVTDVSPEASCNGVRVAELPALNKTCDAFDRYFSIGDALPAGPVYVGSGASCVALDAIDPRMPRAPHKLGAELPITMFIKAGLVPDGGSARVAPLWLRASDGSAEAWAGWDTARGEAVYPMDWPNLAADGSGGKWQPGWIASKSSYTFADASCTQPVGSFTACGNAAVKSVYEAESNGCGLGANYYEAGAVLDAAHVFVNAGTCQPNDPTGALPDQHYVVAGTPIPASSFTDVVSVVEGSSRIQLVTPGVDGHAIDPRYTGFRDTKSATVCSPMLAADGVLRCLPINVAVFFADDACTVPVLVIGRSTSGCPGDPPPLPPAVGISENASAAGCSNVSRNHMFPVGAVNTGVIYASDGTDCRALPADQTAMVTVYNVGPELPPTDFVEIATSTPF